MRAGWTLFVLGLVAVAVAVYSVVTREPEAAPGGGRPPYVLPVTLATVARGEFRGHAQLTGTVRSRRSAALAFEAEGRIVELGVREGDRVEQGAVLARLEGADQRLAVASAEASLALARSELAKLEAGTRAEEKRRLEADLAEAQARAMYARSDLTRARTLKEQEVGSQATVEKLESELSAAEARVAAAQAALDEARAGTRAEDLEVARAKVHVAASALATAREELAKTELKAPWAGAVVSRLRAEGDHVDAGESVIELVDLDRREIVVEVPPRLARDVRPGGRVRVTLDEASGFALDAAIAARAPAAEEQSRNFRALVDVDAAGDPEGVLAPGLFVRLDVELVVLPDAFVVPSDAVRTTEQGTIVVRAQAAPPPETPPAPGAPPAPPFVAEWVPVRVLAAADGQSAVASTGPALAAGDPIVQTGVDIAFPGMPLLPRGGASDAGAPK